LVSMVYWLENKPQCNNWGFSFLFKTLKMN